VKQIRSKGSRLAAPAPMRVLYRFSKPGHWAEIRERKVTQFQALEFFVFVDGSLLESQMFYSARVDEYPASIEKRIAQFVEGGWIEERNWRRAIVLTVGFARHIPISLASVNNDAERSGRTKKSPPSRCLDRLLIV
jgi:hypothetical protein